MKVTESQLGYIVKQLEDLRLAVHRVTWYVEDLIDQDDDKLDATLEDLKVKEEC